MRNASTQSPMGLPLNTIAEAMIASAQASAQTTNVEIGGFELGMC